MSFQGFRNSRNFKNLKPRLAPAKLCFASIAATIPLLLAASGCAHGPFAHRGPEVLSAHSEPGTVELNRDLVPTHRAAILAEIRDTQSRVTSVVLKIYGSPIEIPMRNTHGTTWRAELSSRRLEQMAVVGKTTRYQVDIIARDQDGGEGRADKIVEIAVKTPGISRAVNDAGPG